MIQEILAKEDYRAFQESARATSWSPYFANWLHHHNVRTAFLDAGYCVQPAGEIENLPKLINEIEATEHAKIFLKSCMAKNKPVRRFRVNDQVDQITVTVRDLFSCVEHEIIQQRYIPDHFWPTALQKNSVQNNLELSRLFQDWKQESRAMFEQRDRLLEILPYGYRVYQVANVQTAATLGERIHNCLSFFICFPPEQRNRMHAEYYEPAIRRGELQYMTDNADTVLAIWCMLDGKLVELDGPRNVPIMNTPTLSLPVSTYGIFDGVLREYFEERGIEFITPTMAEDLGLTTVKTGYVLPNDQRRRHFPPLRCSTPQI